MVALISILTVLGAISILTVLGAFLFCIFVINPKCKKDQEEWNKLIILNKQKYSEGTKYQLNIDEIPFSPLHLKKGL